MPKTEAIAKIRRLMGESAQDRKAQDNAEALARRQFAMYEFNTMLPAVDPAPRAKALRAVARIVGWFGWAGPEVTRFLDDQGAHSVDFLADDQVQALAGRLLQLEECAREGYDSPDAPVAR